MKIRTKKNNYSNRNNFETRRHIIKTERVRAYALYKTKMMVPICSRGHAIHIMVLPLSYVQATDNA